MASCATPVIYVWCFRCITCVEIQVYYIVADICIIYMFYTWITYVLHMFIHVLQMYELHVQYT